MIGDLFIVRKVSPDVLKSMNYDEVVYWHDWHKLADNAERQENERIKNLKP